MSRMRQGRYIVCVCCAMLLALSMPSAFAEAQTFTQEELIEDTRQLAEIIESTHADPYINGGGKIAFHRGVWTILESIPEGGMGTVEYLRLIRPLVASIGDGHTFISTTFRASSTYPGGVPLLFGVVENSLYVCGLPRAMRSSHSHLLGARLVSVEGVPLDELRKRVAEVDAVENDYKALLLLADRSLVFAPYLQELIPSWSDTTEIELRLQHAGGGTEDVSLELPVFFVSRNANPIESQADLPSSSSPLFYTFLDPERRTAYLKVEHMGSSSYREASESNGQPELISSGLPSVTEVFASMVEAMHEAGSDALIVDLRTNEGGHPIMYHVLLYMLYGKDPLRDVYFSGQTSGGGYTERYSELWYSHVSVTIEELNEDREIPYEIGDYSFDRDFSGRPEEFNLDSSWQDMIDWYAQSDTFYADFETGLHEEYYLPEHVLVLVSPETFSSGAAMMRSLAQAGASLVGTPSAQPTNSFGRNMLHWRLGHTGIDGYISIGYTTRDTSLPAHGSVYPVDYELTYERLAEYSFDPHATFLYALDLLADWRVK